MTAPLIGITAYQYVHPQYGWEYQISYAKNAAAIDAAGGLPVFIPTNVQPATLQQIYARLDGLLLPGGGDINPQVYQQEAHETVGFVDDVRDTVEVQLTRQAIADDLPVFGICRGLQMLNVALGGSLIQDVPSMVDQSLHHPHDINNPRGQAVHDVTVQENSLLHRIVGNTTIAVNSLHHQAVDRLGAGLVKVAQAPDGVVEGVEMPDKTFVLAVQWHPEDMVQNDERMKSLFVALVDAARKRMPATI